MTRPSGSTRAQIVIELHDEASSGVGRSRDGVLLTRGVRGLSFMAGLFFVTST